LESTAQIGDLIRTLGFPIVLKSPGPPLSEAAPEFPFRVLYAHNEEQLREYIDRYCSDGAFPLFQECAAGRIHNLCCFAVKGEVLAVHQYHSVRRYKGAGVLRKIIPPNPALENYSRAMLEALEWDGVAHVGFFVHEDRDRIWYMETNARFWASVQGSIHAGWDFPYWAYQYFRLGERPDPGPIRLGSQTCWHRGDLEALLMYLRGGEVPATGTNPSKLRAMIQYLGGFRPRIRADVFRWTDPMPAIIDHWQLVGRLWASFRQKLSQWLGFGRGQKEAGSP
jgi:hypothetical protein